MKIFHQTKTRNNTLRAVPITGNYLIQEKSGMLRWAEPNDSFSLFSNTGGNTQVITNIRYDDTEHSCDLFLYTNILDKDRRSGKNYLDIMEHNRINLDRSRNWYIRQFFEIDRPGVRRFTGLPLVVFLQYWRKPFPLDQLSAYGLRNGQTKLVIKKNEVVTHEFNIFLKWPELIRDFESEDRTRPARPETESMVVIPWLRKNCRGGFIPFSDYDSMFVEPEEEVLYMMDVMF